MPDREEVLPVFLLLLTGKKNYYWGNNENKHLTSCRLTTKLPNHGKLISKKKTLDQASEYIGHMERLLKIKAKGRVGVILSPIKSQTTNNITNTSSTITIPFTTNPTTNYTANTNNTNNTTTNTTTTITTTSTISTTTNIITNTSTYTSSIITNPTISLKATPEAMLV